jgi:hypothetical protein
MRRDHEADKANGLAELARLPGVVVLLELHVGVEARVRAERILELAEARRRQSSSTSTEL